MTTVTVSIWKEKAKAIEQALNLQMIGDKASIDTKIFAEKISAGGYSRVLITFEIEDSLTKHRTILIDGEKHIMTYEEVRSYTDTEEEAQQTWNTGKVSLLRSKL